MTEDDHRRIVASLMAHRFAIDFLLRQALALMTPPQRAELARLMLLASARTEQYAGATKDDNFGAERLADTVIQAQQIVDQMMAEALRACERLEAANPPPAPEKPD